MDILGLPKAMSPPAGTGSSLGSLTPSSFGTVRNTGTPGSMGSSEDTVEGSLGAQCSLESLFGQRIHLTAWLNLVQTVLEQRRGASMWRSLYWGSSGDQRLG